MMYVFSSTTKLWLLWVFVAIYGCYLLPLGLSYQKTIIGDLEIDLGASQGLDADSRVTQDTLQKILKGVQSGNKENIYFYGLLKLYGISVTKNMTVAAEHFLAQSNRFHTPL